MALPMLEPTPTCLHKRTEEDIHVTTKMMYSYSTWLKYKIMICTSERRSHLEEG